MNSCLGSVCSPRALLQTSLINLREHGGQVESAAGGAAGLPGRTGAIARQAEGRPSQSGLVFPRLNRGLFCARTGAKQINGPRLSKQPSSGRQVPPLHARPREGDPRVGNNPAINRPHLPATTSVSLIHIHLFVCSPLFIALASRSLPSGSTPFPHSLPSSSLPALHAPGHSPRPPSSEQQPWVPPGELNGVSQRFGSAVALEISRARHSSAASEAEHCYLPDGDAAQEAPCADSDKGVKGHASRCR